MKIEIHNSDNCPSIFEMFFKFIFGGILGLLIFAILLAIVYWSPTPTLNF
jgi:hypothetical protein